MPSRTDFTCFSLSPIELEPASIALATARAGGVGLLDLEFCPEHAWSSAHDRLGQLMALLRPGQSLGLRLRLDQIKRAHDAGLLACLANCKSFWVVVVDWTGRGNASDQIAQLHATLDANATANDTRRLLLELTAIDQLVALPPHPRVDGLVAKGQEAGGWCGEESTFVLVQGLLARTEMPLYAQGAIGPRAAAACRAAGGAGVVLDDSLLLMPESPLPRQWQRWIEGCSGQDSFLLGDDEAGQRALRLLLRPGWSAAERLRTLAAQSDQWRDKAPDMLGWDVPEERAWPIGQGIGEAARLRARYHTTGRLVQAILGESEHTLRAIRAQPQLRAGGPLARAFGTAYPIMQGPMTRVSDRAEFAADVAKAGALPMVALALLRANAVEQLLSETARQLGERPWGVGLLGFAPSELLEAQLEVVTRIRPRFALIAGGRPDQAKRLEALGIASWLHSPTPALARLYIEQGARRLIFEGRECGGHVGPLGSFALWEGAIAALLDVVPKRLASEVQILFAGGIHDARSARMIEALAAPLTERGISIGVLMGTAYLFTREAVASGAITAGFQRQALDCARTVNLETGPGHASRCAITPFVEAFAETARGLRAEGRDPAEISRSLDALCLGRLRIAAKGIGREGDKLVELDTDAQQRDGMYMIGQVAALRDAVTDMESLHRELCTPLAESIAPEPKPIEPPSPSDIAIIGIGTILPRANSPAEFWRNLVDQVDAITEIPPTRWDWSLYYDPDPHAHDKVYSKWGCFIDEVPFDPARFGIPPKSLPSIDPIQLLSLETVRRALDDAGYLDGGFDREHSSVILGYSGGLGELGEHYVTRAELCARIADPAAELLGELPEWSEDSFPGILPNVAAGRVANRFDLGGANFTVDAACASSLTAIDVAVAQLESGRCNLAIAGGVDTKLSPFGYLCFSKTPALTPKDRSRPFDSEADGIMLGEGVAMVVLKRLTDAEADGDRIYAVIKASASSSDGKALGLTAPRDIGQRRAFSRAYRKAGIDPASIGLYEAHGTGTRLGDETEAKSISGFLTEHGAAPSSCVLGSIKALIGHTKAAAGVSALIKTALALHHRTLPPQPGIRTPLASLREPTSPMALLQAPLPWLQADQAPRRAGVSAFGFGGTNCHCVLEEYRGQPQPSVPGAVHWPYELILLAAVDQPGLMQTIEHLRGRLRETSVSLITLGAEYAASADASKPWRLGIVVHDRDELMAALDQVERHLAGTQDRPLPPHIQIASGNTTRGGLALLFPGQGAQSLEMAREATLMFEPLRAAFERADRVFAKDLPQPLSRYVFPRGLWNQELRAAATASLTATEIAQPALGCVETGFLTLIETLGIRADMVAGHSYGEYVALAAAGVLSYEALLRLSRDRGQAMAAAGGDGAMAAVSAQREILEPLLADSEVVLANHNAPEQSVLSGPRAALTALLEQLDAQGIATRMLPVSGAFHSPLIAASQEPLTAAINAVAMAPPRLAVYSNINACPYPDEPEAIRAHLALHLLSPVEFVAQIEAMYAAGARTFLEVGPRTILSGLVARILDGRANRVIALDGQGSGLRGLLIALASLFAAGQRLDAAALFDGRIPPPGAPAPTSVSQGQWLVSGGGVRRHDQPPHSPRPYKYTSQKLAPSFEPAVRSMSMQDSAQPPLSATQSQPARPSGTSPDRDATLAAWSAYQETMRKFLEVQEQVMANFLGSGSAPATGSSTQSQAGQLEAVTPTPPSANSTEPSPDAPSSTAQADTPSESNQIDRATLIARLLQVVSECTGYPPDMLGLDQALEAELGIDSIKRVEILAGIERVLPAALADAMRANMNDISRAATLNALADALLQLDAGPEQVPTTHLAPTTASVVETSEATLDRETLITRLLDVVSDCTGYPPDMLGLDQALEAELGIDSIKRVEIFAGIERALPARLAEAMRARMDEISRAPTLNSLTDALLQLQDLAQTPAAAVPPRPPETNPACSKPRSETCIDRFLMQPSSAPLPARRSVSIEGQVLVTGEGLSVASTLVEQLQQLGLAASLLSAESLASPETLSTRLDELRKHHGPVVHVIHLAGLSAGELPEDLATWQAMSTTQVKQLFQLLQASADDLRAHQGRVLSASLLGGAFGRNGRCGPGSVLAAGNLGMLRTLALEWPEVKTRAVDFAPASETELTKALLDELFAEDEASEISYETQRRLVWNAQAAPLAADASTQPNQPAADWVVLALGGARGITAQVLDALLVPGMTLVILGRSPLPGQEDTASKGLDEPDALRRHFIEASRRNGEQVTPVEVDRRVRQRLRAREIRANLDHFSAAGARVEYHDVDVRDGDAFVKMIDRIYSQHGHIDALIQGVGIIEDKLLTDKQTASFNRVFDTKVDSTYLLCRHLRPESLKLALLFASVAGRTGNRGQCDYASANEVINRMAWWMHEHWPAVRVLSINWGPWATSGMASEAVNRLFRDRGVIPIESEVGRRFVRDEVAHGAPDAVELIAGSFAINTPLDDAPQPAVNGVPEDPPDLPLIGRARPQMETDGTQTLDYTFSLDRDLYLDDHRLDGSPVVPAAVAMELMAEFVQACWPAHALVEVRELRVLQGIVLTDDAPRDIQLRARANTSSSAERLEVSVEIRAPERYGPSYRATLLLGAITPTVPAPPPPLRGGRYLDAPAAYSQHCFHGPRFQRLRSLVRIDTAGVDGTVVASDPAAWLADGSARTHWLFDPGVVDTLLQSAILWARQERDSYPLPNRFKRVVRHAVLPADEDLSFTSRVVRCTETMLELDFLLTDAQGRVLLELQGIEASHSHALNRLAPDESV